MGMFVPGDILKAKVNELLGYTEIVKRIIKYILVLSKGCFYKHIDHLRVKFYILLSTGLKSRILNVSLGSKYIPSLVYLSPGMGLNLIQGRCFYHRY